MKKYKINEVQETNYLVVKSLSSMFESTLGPFGHYKLLEGEDVSEFVTTCGYNILKEIQVEHPTAKLFVEAAKKHGDIYWDGVTQLILFLSELLDNAFSLFDYGIHPLTIGNGYSKAMNMAEKYLTEICVSDYSNLEDVANTALKDSVYERDRILNAVIECMKLVSDNGKADPDDVLIVSEKGGSVFNIESIEGVVVDREPVRNDMPAHIVNGRIALLNYPLEGKGPRTESSRLLISDPYILKDMIYSEDSLLLKEIEKVKEIGANVICCQKGISEAAGELLSKFGIFAIKRVSNRDMKRIAKASGGEIVNSVDELRPSTLGKVGLVDVKKIGKNKYSFFKGFPNKSAATLVVRGGSIHVIEGIVGELKCALYSVSSLLKTPKALPGGGATEVELAMRLKRYAKTIPGKEQLAIEKFADALEIIPKVLAKNSGLNPVDVLLRLRAEHAGGNRYHGLEAVNGEIGDMVKAGVVEAYEVKRNALRVATQAAIQFLRVDDVIFKKEELTDSRLEIEKKSPEFKFKGGKLKY